MDRAPESLPTALRGIDWTLSIGLEGGALLVCAWMAWRARRELVALRDRLRAVPTHDAQPERESNQATPLAARRQMTLGECIAVAQLSERFDRQLLADIGLGQVMRVVDAMRVCTTCGQLERDHSAERTWTTACTSYAPRNP